MAVLGAGGALCNNQSTHPTEPIAKTPEARTIQTVNRRLRSTGVSVDRSKLLSESKLREEVALDLGAQIDLGLRPEHMDVLWQMRGILEATPPIRSLKRLRREAVEARLPGVRVYYATDRRAMVFIQAEAQDTVSLEAAVAAQLVYAFYDQGPGGLAEALYEPQGRLDGVRVRKCLLEGHARLAELLARHGSIDNLSQEAMAQLNPPPLHLHATLTETLCGPGAEFLYARYREGGWGAVLRAVRSPPPSTEQLIHPSKIDLDFPVNVGQPGWPEDDGEDDYIGSAKLVYEDVMGELTMHRMLLERGVDPEQAQLAVVGWDGDLLRIYEHVSGERVVIWRSAWDREIDAQQFAAAIAPKGIEPRAFRVERHGRVVDAVSSTPEMASRLHAVLSARPGEPTAQPSDAASTAAIEARLGG
ncbi:MAG: hypothetical protein AAF799_29355 [Myxococcota bacterium]